MVGSRMTGLACALTLLVVFWLGISAPQAKDLLWQTNSGGNDVHIFDVETRQLVRRLVVGANPHGIAHVPGDDTIYVSLERNGEEAGELLWVNAETYEIEHRLIVGPEPHAIAVTLDGRWVYVPCRDGHYWVIDASRRKIVAKIETGGRPHNTTAAPDGSLVYLSPMGPQNRVTIVDPNKDHAVVGGITFSGSVRPPAIAPLRDLFFQHVDGLNGFEVADLEGLRVVARVEHSVGLGMLMVPNKIGFLGFSGLSRCHGLAVRPGDGEIWSVCGVNATIHSIENSVFPEIGHIRLPSKGYWMTFSPDGALAFIALADTSQVAVVDAQTRMVITMLNAGTHPKRNLVISK